MPSTNWLRTIGPAGAISLASLACAWAAICLALVGALRLSVLAALAAFLLDLLDGFVARRLGQTSEFGRRLDSMVDVVNYSVYVAILSALYLAPGPLGWTIGFVVIATGVLRLSRFTLEGFDDDQPIKYYYGVVVCHLSLAAITLLIVRSFITNVSIVSAIVLVLLAVLQLTRIPIRKTGRQALWASLTVPLAIGAILWLR